MAATSRFVRYPVAGTTSVSDPLEGERGVVRGTGDVGDTFTIPGSATNQIRVNVDGAGTRHITLTSGVALDARFVARDMQRKVQAFGSECEFMSVDFTNYKSGDGESHFVFKSGTVGGSSTVALSAGDLSALTLLGLTSNTQETGTTFNTATSRVNDTGYTGTITASGTYGGMLDEEYYVVISNAVLASISADGGNTYAGTATITGDWDHGSASTYVVTIDTANGEVMNAGSGNVPTFTVNDTSDTDNETTPQELLYSDYYYHVGQRGQRIRFTDAQFGDEDFFTVTNTPAPGGGGTSGNAEFVYTSSRGENAIASIPTATAPVSVGQKGLIMQWTDSGSLVAKDAWRIICRAPTPEAYGVTSMVYGNVTVTTNSAVKVHQFEIMSGATVLSNVKFSLQSDGTFQHHDQGNGDTEFHYGTVGAGQRADGTGSTAGTGLEWKASVAATDISQTKDSGNTGSPTFLHASVLDLGVVADADNAEAVGNSGLVSDFIFTSIKLGASETGANSQILHRIYFDYS